LENNLDVDISSLDALTEGFPALIKLAFELDRASFTHTLRLFVQHRICDEVRKLWTSVLGPKLLEKREEGIARITFERL
jgi:hypothetical protein